MADRSRLPKPTITLDPAESLFCRLTTVTVSGSGLPGQ